MSRFSLFGFGWKHWLLALLAVTFLGVGVRYTLKITGSPRSNRSAFLRWRNQIHGLSDGVNIYTQHDYPNPPIMALLLSPLAALPPMVGSLAWFFLKAGMSLAIFLLVFRLVEVAGQPFPPWAMGLTVLLSIRPLASDLTHGNVNIFILFLVVVALYCFKTGRDYRAGLLLALSIACKITPALFLPYFLWKRAWKTLAGSCLGLLLFLWLIPGGVLGFDYNAELLRSWTQRMVVPFLIEGEVTTEHQNQSLPGVAHRLLTDSASFSTWTKQGYVPLEKHNLAELSPLHVGLLVKGCMLAFAAIVICTCRTRGRGGPLLAAEFSLILLGMLLFSERTWKHHCVTLVLPFAVTCYLLAVGWSTRTLRFGGIAALLLTSLLYTSTSTGLFAEFAKIAEAYGAYTWANLLLVGWMAAVPLLAGEALQSTRTTLKMVGYFFAAGERRAVRPTCVSQASVEP